MWIPFRAALRGRLILRTNGRAIQRRRRIAGGEALESRRVLASHPFDLADLFPGNGGDGSEGTVFDGWPTGPTEFSTPAGRAIGDINGDGFDDLAFGDPGQSPNGTESGRTFIVFGGGAGLPARFELSDLLAANGGDGSLGFVINGSAAADVLGVAVERLGDINGDGIDDILVSAPGSNISVHDAGQVYVVFGRASFPAEFAVSSLHPTNGGDGSQGFSFNGGNSNREVGRIASALGDVNGDGFNDFSFRGNQGVAYIVFGRGDGFPPALSPPVFTSSASIQVAVGNLVTAGDVDGDGYDDMLARAFDGVTQESYLIYGGPDLANSMVSIHVVNGTNGFRMRGPNSLALDGPVAAAGDINGDGFGDVIVGGGYVLLGRPRSEITSLLTSFNGQVNLLRLADVANGDIAFRVGAAASGEPNARPVAAAGDVNGDGFDDLLLIDSRVGTTAKAQPAAYVVYGRADTFPALLEPGDIDGVNGLAILEPGNWERTSAAAAPAGDVNGDGFADILLSAALNSSNAGMRQSYLVFGGDLTGAVTHPGSTAPDALAGDAAANILVGGQGNDTLAGNGGRDVLLGGAGDDTLAIADVNFHRAAGGNGRDTLRVDAGGLEIDLADFHGRLSSIERIDLAGSGDNRLIVTRLSTLNLSDHDNTLVVVGDAGDWVEIEYGWTFAGVVEIDAQSYQSFRSGAATINVLSAIAVGPLPGDANSDGIVDVGDVAAISANWGGIGPAGDVNHDGVVDIFDVAFVSANWNAGATTPRTASAIGASAALVSDAGLRDSADDPVSRETKAPTTTTANTRWLHWRLVDDAFRSSSGSRLGRAVESFRSSLALPNRARR